MDTIFAVSSGRPPAAIAVIRISGTRAFAAANALAGSVPADRRAGLRALRNADGGLLDRALVIGFPGPATATGEDLVELHCHGGRAVVAAIERALGALPGLRPAEAGEFTRRALLSGRIDLTEAEGLADLLEADTERQRVAALAAAEGQVSRQVGGWLAAIAMLSARAEAMLDFSDEGDVADDDDAVDVLVAAIRDLGEEIAAVIDAPPVERLRDGIGVVIAGPPNSGKSTLLNLLSQRDAAIVSPIAGTTRDRIEATVVRSGIAYVLTDTAGLVDETDDVIEAIGVARAADAIAAADILLWLADTVPPRADALWIHARSDVAGRGTMPAGRIAAIAQDDRHSIEAVWTLIDARSVALLPRVDGLPFKRRQRVLCVDAAEAMTLRIGHDLLIVAEHLRRARVALAAVLGMDATEEMLDSLFLRFCIGK